MLDNIRRLALGLGLIAAASALLLLSDLGSRAKSTPSPTRMVSVAVLQQASQAILDQGREGMLAGMEERGWVVGKNLRVKNYNAEGDMPTAQTIAREMANGDYDLLLTVSTPSLQAVANANRTTQKKHVFALVTDPVAAGVGVSRENPLDHPAWLAGYGTMQPVRQAFETARVMNPNLKTVGIVWNAGEANSEAQVKLARKVCADMGITLFEATVENSAGVSEAAASLTARGAEALWVNGDVTVITAIDSVVAAANKAGIPVFTVIPPNVKRGALFDLGANYHEVGRLAGVLAGDILNGRDPATVPIENAMPEILTINLQALGRLSGNWKIPDDIREKAQIVIDENGQETRSLAAPPVPVRAAAPQKKWKIAVIEYNETPPSEETIAGMKDGWQQSALKEGTDYEIKIQSAQGDMSALGGLIDAAVTNGADLIVPLSTPTLQTALHRVRNVPIVFSLVANPIAAGAGTSYTDHMPNVTGVAVLSPYADMLDLLEKYYPNIKRIGTLFCPAETNSVDLKNSLEALCKKRGFVLDAVAANSSAEFTDAALSLASKPIDAIVQISDNLSSAGFTALTKAARQTKKPLFSLNSTTVPMGAAIALGRDYHDAGITTVHQIEKVIAGEQLKDIPFILPPHTKLTVSPGNAKAVGMEIPDGLLKEATKVSN
jgi:ABC-type uncharacterized transport system substrate-binding protein